MKFEPQSFFIGLIDFFSILLPDGLFVYVTKCQFMLGQVEFTETWMVIIFTSYVAGHFNYLISVCLLDKHIYEFICELSHQLQIERLAKGEELNSKLRCWLGWNESKTVRIKF
ncbi:hypothetical protein [Mariniflexile sp. HMF6888]|uniref:hypothetical protein n=1 Tax=Mariniflexile sp. HMF6888 TaxID=3373086 RepID=UPI0037A7324E